MPLNSTWCFAIVPNFPEVTTAWEYIPRRLQIKTFQRKAFHKYSISFSHTLALTPIKWYYWGVFCDNEFQFASLIWCLYSAKDIDAISGRLDHRWDVKRIRDCSSENCKAWTVETLLIVLSMLNSVDSVVNATHWGSTISRVTAFWNVKLPISSWGTRQNSRCNCIMHIDEYNTVYMMIYRASQKILRKSIWKFWTTMDRFGPCQIILVTLESFGPFLILRTMSDYFGHFREFWTLFDT